MLRKLTVACEGAAARVAVQHRGALLMAPALPMAAVLPTAAPEPCLQLYAEASGLVIRHNFEGGRSVFELNDADHHDQPRNTARPPKCSIPLQKFPTILKFSRVRLFSGVNGPGCRLAGRIQS